MPDTHYCPTFWALYDDLCRQAEAGEIDDYGVAYRLKDHRLGCEKCASVQDNRQNTFESVKRDFTKRGEK